VHTFQADQTEDAKAVQKHNTPAKTQYLHRLVGHKLGRVQELAIDA
jgi:2-keto-4-pentenoate hydratase